MNFSLQNLLFWPYNAQVSSCLARLLSYRPHKPRRIERRSPLNTPNAFKSQLICLICQLLVSPIKSVSLIVTAQLTLKDHPVGIAMDARYAFKASLLISRTSKRMIYVNISKIMEGLNQLTFLVTTLPGDQKVLSSSSFIADQRLETR